MIIDQIIDQDVIPAERFKLRPLRRSDAGLLRMHSGDERVARATRSIPHPLPPGAAEAFVARSLSQDRVEDVWVMDGSGNNLSEVLGVVTLKRMDRDQSEISYWVAPAFWNTGFASEAVTAIVEANPQQAKTLFAEVFQDNPASARVVTNAGFEYLGDAEAFSVARNATVKTWTYLKKLD
ncbi:MAG: GNAT family N-acetyltransferase [Rhodobacteraceae bacterium]|nr:GNAT family N-acetyltransferase [Paracoccaceae bacterium]